MSSEPWQPPLFALTKTSRGLTFSKIMWDCKVNNVTFDFWLLTALRNISLQSEFHTSWANIPYYFDLLKIEKIILLMIMILYVENVNPYSSSLIIFHLHNIPYTEANQKWFFYCCCLSIMRHSPEYWVKAMLILVSDQMYYYSKCWMHWLHVLQSCILALETHIHSISHQNRTIYSLSRNKDNINCKKKSSHSHLFWCQSSELHVIFEA